MSLQAWMASSSAPASLEPPEQPTATRATAAAPAMPDMRRRVRGVRMMGSLHFVVQFGGCGGGSTGCVDAGEPGGARRRAPERSEERRVGEEWRVGGEGAERKE